MASAIIDASIASAWCFPDEQTDYTKAVFLAVSSSAVDARAPRLLAYEIRNSVLMGVRRKRINRADAEEFLLALNDLNITFNEPVSYNAVFHLAEKHGLTVYDAAYLNLALEEKLPLATLDRQLIDAAKKAGVTLLQP